MLAIPIISLIPRNGCIFLFAKPSLTALPLTFKQRMDSLLPSNKAVPSSPFHSPEKVNGHKKHEQSIALGSLLLCRESESLIKSWSTWDLARLAPEQANYLDWFLKGVGFL